MTTTNENTVRRNWTMSNPMTDREAILRLLEIAEEYPDRVNPTNKNGECLYQGYDGEEGVRPPSHCIVGELAYLEGWELPEPGVVEGAAFVAGEFGWPVEYYARERLTQVQNIFDGLDIGGVSAGPIPWGKAAAKVRETILAAIEQEEA